MNKLEPERYIKRMSVREYGQAMCEIFLKTSW